MSPHVLTLIAAADTRPIADHLANALGADVDWLSPNLAADIFFDGDPAQAARLARGISSTADIVIQPVADRRKMLLVSDMESTLIHNEMLDEMADLIGVRDAIAAVTHRAMNGELDFAASLRERVALFKGQPESLLAEAATRIRFDSGARTLVRTMREHGARTILVSGGFHVFSAPVRDALGCERDYANHLAIESGRIAGTVREPILDSGAKAAVLHRCAAEFGIAAARTLAVGDGANDLAMLGAAGLGIAYHAKPHVRAQIGNHVDHADLTALLYLQGYRDSDFAT
jgi:phosphoserine phosphatase